MLVKLSSIQYNKSQSESFVETCFQNQANHKLHVFRSDHYRKRSLTRRFNSKMTVVADPSVEREESSSSSGDSLGGVVRKAFPSRKGKAGALGKRHVRSSSGYSSHNDETTFR